MVNELENRWEKACFNVKHIIGENWIEQIEQIDTLCSSLKKQKDKKIIIGLCGPGASGKSTLLKNLCSKYLFKNIINTTTRKMRSEETDGLDYRFISLEQYNNDKKSNCFAVDVQKSGRGFYGIYYQDAFSVVEQSDKIVVIESPLVLSRLFDILNKKYENQLSFYIFYLLPEAPYIKNMVKFMSNRKKHIDLDSIMIEHGWRQIEEFSSIISINHEFCKTYVIQSIPIDSFSQILHSAFAE